MGERGVKDDLKALDLSQRKDEQPYTDFPPIEGEDSMCSTDGDLKRMTFWVYSKCFKSPSFWGLAMSAGPALAL